MYQSILSPSGRSATHSPQEEESFWSRWRELSSTMAHPSRERIPFSSSFSLWLRRSQPLHPSRVRVVPLRLPDGSSPGCQTTGLPFSLKVTLKLPGAKRPPLYSRVSLPVLMVTPPPCFVALKAGTGRSRLIMARLALSSNCPSSAHSILIRRSVKTVKRAFPAMTMAPGLAFGLAGALSEVAGAVAEVPVAAVAVAAVLALAWPVVALSAAPMPDVAVPAAVLSALARPVAAVLALARPVAAVPDVAVPAAVLSAAAVPAVRVSAAATATTKSMSFFIGNQF